MKRNGGQHKNSSREDREDMEDEASHGADKEEDMRATNLERERGPMTIRQRRNAMPNQGNSVREMVQIYEEDDSEDKRRENQRSEQRSRSIQESVRREVEGAGEGMVEDRNNEASNQQAQINFMDIPIPVLPLPDSEIFKKYSQTAFQSAKHMIWPNMAFLLQKYGELESSLKILMEEHNSKSPNQSQRIKQQLKTKPMKKIRRKAAEIKRILKCPIENCPKGYEKSSIIKNHMIKIHRILRRNIIIDNQKVMIREIQDEREEN